MGYIVAAADEFPRLAQLIIEFPWIHDGIRPAELDAIYGLYSLASEYGLVNLSVGFRLLLVYGLSSRRLGRHLKQTEPLGEGLGCGFSSAESDWKATALANSSGSG